MDNATFRENMNAVAVAASKVSTQANQAQEPGIHDLLACLRLSDRSWLFLAIAFLSFLVSVIMLVVIIVNNTNVDAYVAENEMLVYQYENDIYDNDNDLGKRDLMEDIQKWNEDLAYRRKAQDDFWVGIFYPNVHDQFEFIELK